MNFSKNQQFERQQPKSIIVSNNTSFPKEINRSRARMCQRARFPINIQVVALVREMLEEIAKIDIESKVSIAMTGLVFVDKTKTRSKMRPRELSHFLC